jgi:hypothetical protein
MDPHFSGLRKGGIGVRYVILDGREEEIVVDKEFFGYQQGSSRDPIINRIEVNQ